MSNNFYSWLKGKYGSVAGSPGYHDGDSFDAGYDLAQSESADKIARLEAECAALKRNPPRIKPTHDAAHAFWKYWEENGETHTHGYFESTWGAINAALKVAGLSDPVGPWSEGGGL